MEVDHGKNLYGIVGKLQFYLFMICDLSPTKRKNAKCRKPQNVFKICCCCRDKQNEVEGLLSLVGTDREQIFKHKL